MGNRMDTSFKRHAKVIEEYALDRFKKVIVPFAKKHNYSFLAGMGSYAFWDKNGDLVDDNQLPKYILKVLETEVPGDEFNSLGNYMPAYPEEK